MVSAMFLFHQRRSAVLMSNIKGKNCQLKTSRKDWTNSSTMPINPFKSRISMIYELVWCDIMQDYPSDNKNREDDSKMYQLVYSAFAWQ